MNEGIVWAFIVPIIIFLVFVAPIWLILHYRSKKKINEGMSIEDSGRISELAERAEFLRDRVRTLEKLLDQENPNWRRND